MKFIEMEKGIVVTGGKEKGKVWFNCTEFHFRKMKHFGNGW